MMSVTPDPSTSARRKRRWSNRSGVANQVDKLQVGVARVEIQPRSERAKSVPPLAVIVFKKARRRAVQYYEVQPAVAGQVHKLRPSARRLRAWLHGHEFDGRELRQRPLDAILPADIDRAEIALVEPCAGLLAQNAGDALAVQVDPLIAGGVETGREILQAAGIQFPRVFVDHGLAVFELQRRQRTFEVASAGFALVSALGDRGDD